VTLKVHASSLPNSAVARSSKPCAGTKAAHRPFCPSRTGGTTDRPLLLRGRRGSPTLGTPTTWLLCSPLTSALLFLNGFRPPRRGGGSWRRPRCCSRSGAPPNLQRLPITPLGRYPVPGRSRPARLRIQKEGVHQRTTRDAEDRLTSSCPQLYASRPVKPLCPTGPSEFFRVRPRDLSCCLAREGLEGRLRRRRREQQRLCPDSATATYLLAPQGMAPGQEHAGHSTRRPDAAVVYVRAVLCKPNRREEPDLCDTDAAAIVQRAFVCGCPEVKKQLGDLLGQRISRSLVAFCWRRCRGQSNACWCAITSRTSHSVDYSCTRDGTD